MKIENNDANTTQVVADEAVTDTVVKTPSVSSRFGIVTLVIALIGVGISIDGLLKLKEWNAGLRTFQAQMDERLVVEQKHLNTLEEALKHIDARQKNLDKQIDVYHSTILPVLQKDQPADVLWQIRKAYHWLLQAQLDLRWTEDYQGALLLLNAANNVIESSHLAPLAPVEALIKEDIATLSAMHTMNETVLFEKMSDISKGIAVLPMPSTSSASHVVSTVSTEKTSSETTWRLFFVRAWQAVKKLVIIKPVDAGDSDAVRESLSSSPYNLLQLRQNLNERLMLSLQQAQWALMKKDDTLFHWSLEQTINMIQKNDQLIDKNSPETITCLNDLSMLATQTLAPVFPDLQPACQQLKNYIDMLSTAVVAAEPADNTVDKAPEHAA